MAVNNFIKDKYDARVRKKAFFLAKNKAVRNGVDWSKITPEDKEALISEEEQEVKAGDKNNLMIGMLGIIGLDLFD